MRHLRWQTQSDGDLLARFEWKSIPVRSWLSPEGKIRATELKIEPLDVAPALATVLARDYARFRVEKRYMLQIPAGFNYRIVGRDPAGMISTYYFRPDGHSVPRPSW